MTCGDLDCKEQDKARIASDIPRAALMMCLLEVQKKMQELPGGMNGALVIFVIVLSSMEERALNVSTIANMLDMDRKTVRRTLTTLVEGGYVQVDTDSEDWPVYTRTCTEGTHQWSKGWCNEVYGILRHRLKVHCDAMQPVCKPYK